MVVISLFVALSLISAHLQDNQHQAQGCQMVNHFHAAEANKSSSKANKELQKEFKGDKDVKIEFKDVKDIKGEFTEDQKRRLKKAREELK